MAVTTVSAGSQEVLIGDSRSTVLIGERINPTGRKYLASALKAWDFSIIQKEALSQVHAGADILDVNVVTSGVDEVTLLPRVVEAIMECVNVPLSIDINDPRALEKTLDIYHGKPIINSVTGEENSLNSILPVVKKYKTAVIGLTIDENGIPNDPDKRFEIACKIADRVEAAGIPKEDLIIDCLALTVGADDKAALVTLEAIQKVKSGLGVNQTLGASNISYGLPNREVVNRSFLVLAIEAGVTCPTLDVAKTRQTVLSTDLILGRDRFAQRYIKDYMERQK